MGLEVYIRAFLARPVLVEISIGRVVQNTAPHRTANESQEIPTTPGEGAQ